MVKRVQQIMRGFINLTVTVDDGDVQLSFKKFAGRISNLTRFWIEFFAPQFFDDVLKNFAAQGRYVGGWRALSPEYAAWKLRHFGPLPLLVRSGTMLDSLSIGGRSNVLVAKRDVGVFGSRVPWLKYHQHGTSRMPRRQVLWLGPSRTYQRLLDRFVREEMTVSGLKSA